MTLNGYFDGEKVVLDEPAPQIPPNTRVKIIVAEDGRDVFEAIAANAIKADLPADFAAQHEHYVRGTPRK